MTDEAIKLIKELGFPIAVSISLAFVLYKVVMWLLVEVVQDTLTKFEDKHEALQVRLDKLDQRMMEFEREMMDEFGKTKKWLAEIKSNLQVYIDLTMKGK